MISLLVLSFWGIYIEENFARFLPLGFSQDKSLCSFCMVVLVYILVIFWLMVMMLNVLRSDITIKIQQYHVKTEPSQAFERSQK